MILYKNNFGGLILLFRAPIFGRNMFTPHKRLNAEHFTAQKFASDRFDGCYETKFSKAERKHTGEG
jgi:hypothetical protein